MFQANFEVTYARILGPGTDSYDTKMLPTTAFYALCRNLSPNRSLPIRRRFGHSLLSSALNQVFRNILDFPMYGGVFTLSA